MLYASNINTFNCGLNYEFQTFTKYLVQGKTHITRYYFKSMLPASRCGGAARCCGHWSWQRLLSRAVTNYCHKFCHIIREDRARHIKRYYYTSPNIYKMTQLFNYVSDREMLELGKFIFIIINYFRNR